MPPFGFAQQCSEVLVLVGNLHHNIYIYSHLSSHISSCRVRSDRQTTSRGRQLDRYAYIWEEDEDLFASVYINKKFCKKDLKDKTVYITIKQIKDTQ